jgi:2-haloacid dehalogenase
MNDKEYKALIFDLDDTLINFVPAEKYGLEAVHTKFFADACDVDTFKQFYAPINKQIWNDVSAGKYTTKQVGPLRFELVAEALNFNIDPVIVSQYYENKISDTVHWYDGVEQFFREICVRYPVSIITNGLSVAQNRKIKHMNIINNVKSIFISEEEGIAKPDPRIFISAIATLGCETKDILMIGDSILSDYQGAINVGIDFCWVNIKNSALPPGFSKPKYTVQSVIALEQELLREVAV